MDIKDALQQKLIIDGKMENSYIASESLSKKKLAIPDDVVELFKKQLENKKIYLDDDNVIYSIITGIIKGNIILQGPPGTGKTTIAKTLCEVFNMNFNIATAIEDWTTYDTIGGLFPSVDDEGREIVSGRNGIIVNSVIECCNTMIHEELYDQKQKIDGEVKMGTWLLLDELNRSEIDKVFADFFTVFGSTDVASERKIPLWFHQVKDKKTLWVPLRFRIIGTMNNYDKQFVNDVSNALMRRFTIITILPPSFDKFEKEIEVIEDSLPGRIKNKISHYGTNEITEKNILKIMQNKDYINTKTDVLKLLKRIRYDENPHNIKEPGYLGMQIGTAQIKDFLESVIINVIIRNTKMKSDYEEAFDISFASSIVPLMADQNIEKLDKFKDYFNDYFNKNANWLIKTRFSLMEI